MVQGWQQQQILDWQCEIYTPSEKQASQYGVLYLHDEDGTNVLRGQESILEQYGLIVVAPNCGPCWWMDKLIPDFHADLTPQEFLVDHVAKVGREIGNLDSRPLALLGHGMGGQGALKLAYAHPREFPVVAAISPSIDFHNLLRQYHPVLSPVFDSVEAARQYTPILHVHPLNWPKFQYFCCDPEDYLWYDSADRLRMKLGSIGIPFDCDLQTSKGGDRESYLRQALPGAIEYVATKLDEHRRQLI